MAARSPRIRRPAFLAALVVSASLYAYSLAGIAGAGGDPSAASIAEKAGRSAPVAYEWCPDGHDDAVRL